MTGANVAGPAGALAPAWPQDPFNTRAEKGPSTFDVTHAFTASMIQDLHADRISFLRPLGPKLTAGWELLSISTITSGAPFTVYSGVQQTGVGSNGVDRPDQVAVPDLSTSRKIREDYFGLGENNGSFFAIPLNVPGGSGPNHGRFGVFGQEHLSRTSAPQLRFCVDQRHAVRNTRWRRASRFFSFSGGVFSISSIFVNFGLPANIIRGSGFGEISRTAEDHARQIQFSLKLIF